MTVFTSLVQPRGVVLINKLLAIAVISFRRVS